MLFEIAKIYAFPWLISSVEAQFAGVIFLEWNSNLYHKHYQILLLPVTYGRSVVLSECSSFLQ